MVRERKGTAWSRSPMVKTLQRRFIGIAMLALSATLLFLIVAINMIHFVQITQLADLKIRILYQNDGDFPAPSMAPGMPITEETPYETRYFIVHLDHTAQITDIDLDHVAFRNPEEVQGYLNRIQSRSQSAGYLQTYRYHVFHEDEGEVIIALDCRQQLQSMKTVLLITLLVAFLCALTVLLFLIVFSAKAVRPVAENFEKQRRFVTDASHELKTPLAIISANADVLELNIGENEWVDSIRNQTQRLAQLVGNLIELAKMEETIKKEALNRFCISQVIKDTAQSFEAVMQAKEKNFTVEISEGLYYHGNAEDISRLVSLLLENAVKYSDADGNIRLSFRKQARGLMLKISNTSDSIDPAKFAHLFDRFYRADDSRARETGGYGIGLSVAQAIVHKYRGKITVTSPNPREIVLTVLL